MTNPDRPPPGGDPSTNEDTDRADLVGTDRVGVLVRQTLAAVADATDVVPRPLDLPAPVAPRPVAVEGTSEPTSPLLAPPPVPGHDVDAGDPVHVVPVGLGEGRTRRADRWLPAVAAAAVIIILVGLAAVVVGDRDTVSTGPGDRTSPPTAPSPGPAPAPFDDASFVSPPRDVGDVELTDVDVIGWHAGGAGDAVEPAEPPNDGSAIPVTTNPVLPPFIAAATSGVILNYSFASAGSDGSEEPVHVFVRTGVTLDPVGADIQATEPMSSVDGLTVARLEGCTPTRRSGDPELSVPATLPEPPALVEPIPSPCRVAVTAWTADHVISIDAIDAALVDEVLEGLRRETLIELEARLAGVAHVGDIRRTLEAATAATSEPSAGSTTAPTSDPTSADAPAVDGSTTTPAPEPSECSTWSLVENHLSESGDQFDAGSYEDLLAFQVYTPPELRPDTDRLLELAATTPPPPERAEILARLRAGLATRCGPTTDG